MHAGVILGFVTKAVYLPDEDLYVAVLTNSSNGNPDLISDLLAAVALEIQIPKFEAVKLNEAKAKVTQLNESILLNNLPHQITETNHLIFHHQPN